MREAYEALGAEFAFLDEVLKARAESGLTQAQVAERVGTTQSAIARLESGALKHSPSIATLQKYALGAWVSCRGQVREGARPNHQRLNTDAARARLAPRRLGAALAGL